jgi:hypothetical protein
MKRLYILLLIFITSFSSNGQSILGAWELQSTTDEGIRITNTVTFTKGYYVSSWFLTDSGAFVRTNGGSWEMEQGKVTAILEFDSETSERVGTSLSFTIKLSGDTLILTDTNQQWKRVDNGTPGTLQGAWLMSGRKRDGAIQSRDTSRPRKTMKILSGTRFQWIAYNTETKEFKGTGGGTYTTIDGKYTENIGFFSRDNARVGASLEFTYELIDGAWHHSGLSSKGSPIYEIWSLRE